MVKEPYLSYVEFSSKNFLKEAVKVSGGKALKAQENNNKFYETVKTRVMQEEAVNE